MLITNNLNVNKVTGPDHIGARILKETSSAVAPILRIIFRCLLDTGIIPEDWKAAIILILSLYTKRVTVQDQPTVG